MNQFESVKAAVTLRQAAKAYGLRVLPNGMTCCPFHEDRHPSMKLNEDYFFCFGCGASGDVIDFTARLFGISLKDAAEKLVTFIGIVGIVICGVMYLTARDNEAQVAKAKKRLIDVIIGVVIWVLFAFGANGILTLLVPKAEGVEITEMQTQIIDKEIA